MKWFNEQPKGVKAVVVVVALIFVAAIVRALAGI